VRAKEHDGVVPVDTVPLAKLPALSQTKSSEPSLWMRPETMGSLVAVMNPVQK
jgi:hypothetical protein